MPKITKRVSVPMSVRVASVVADSFNEEKRTVDVIWSTGARVKRSPWFAEDFHEELSLKKSDVRLERLNGGAPFLNMHSQRDLNDIIGVVEKAQIKNKQGTATIRFSSREEVAPIIKDIQDGVIRNVSVGYNIHRFEEMKPAEDGLKVFRAVDWEPMEISAVTIGADSGAKFRSDQENETHQCEIVELERATGEDPPAEVEVEAARTQDPPSPTAEELNTGVEKNKDLRNDNPTGEKDMTKEEIAKLKAAERKAEKDRQSGIRKAVQAAKLEDSFAEELIDADTTLDDARAQVLDKLAAADAEKPTRSATPANDKIEITRDEIQTRNEGIEEAFLHRFRSQTQTIRHGGQEIKMPGFDLTEKGQPYAFRSIIEICRQILESKGESTRMMSRMAVVGRALHSTSDFPEILANVANKTLRGGYERAAATWMPFTRETTAPDFKQISRTNLGDGEELEKVLENGEVRRGTMSEAAEKYNVETFAKIIGVTRQALVNDDLAAFTSVPERMGRKARDLESNELWGLIFANALMADGVALFAAGHSNLSTVPAAPSENGLTEGRKSMRLQTGLDGEVIAIVPQWFYVGPSDETTAEKLVTSIQANIASSVNPFSAAGRTPLQLVVEPRIDTLAGAGSRPWFLSASLDQVDMVEIARLEGEEGPVIESRAGFDVEGMEIKIRSDIGTKAIDHRGLFKNPGA